MLEMSNMSEDIIRLRIRISGHVTGLGLRRKVSEYAEANGICGWIRNHADMRHAQWKYRGQKSN